MKFKKGQVYKNEDANIFVKMVIGKNVNFIEGDSPCAIHNMQTLEAEYLEDYINRWGFERASKEEERFINA